MMSMTDGHSKSQLNTSSSIVTVASIILNKWLEFCSVFTFDLLIYDIGIMLFVNDAAIPRLYVLE